MYHCFAAKRLPGDQFRTHLTKEEWPPLAPRPGLEPGTFRLTAGRYCPLELPGTVQVTVQPGYHPFGGKLHCDLRDGGWI